jgi:hypothetical protein
MNGGSPLEIYIPTMSRVANVRSLVDRLWLGEAYIKIISRGLVVLVKAGSILSQGERETSTRKRMGRRSKTNHLIRTRPS